jgi:hypothetical protein
MRCLTCKYDLRKLAEHRCPECGRVFDPSDPNSFGIEPPKNHPRLTMMLLLALGTYLAAFVVHMRLIVIDTTPLDYAPPTSQWALTFQVFVAGIRAFTTSLLIVPVVIVGYLIYFFVAARWNRRVS